VVLKIRTTVVGRARTMVETITGLTKHGTKKVVTRIAITTIPDRVTRLLRVCLLVPYLVVLMFHCHPLPILLLSTLTICRQALISQNVW